MAEALERAWTVDEFFAWAEKQPGKYELVNGRPARMMAGAKKVHDMIVVNLILALGQKLGQGCSPFIGDFAVETYPGQIRRPDVGVECGQPKQEEYKSDAPRLVAEVLSPSTRDFDSFGKLAEYQSMESLDYIMLIEPNQPAVIFWSRDETRAWRESRLTSLAEHIHLPALGAVLDMREIYNRVEFPLNPRLVLFEPPR